MSKISRRKFLIKSSGAVGCALLAPAFVRQVLDHLHRTDQPLLIAPKKPKDLLYAWRQGDDYQLHLGDPYADPPVISWREYIAEYIGEDPRKLSGNDLDMNYGITRNQLDAPCDYECYYDAWCRSNSPTSAAYHYLDSLDLGPHPGGSGRQIGGLSFYDGPCPGNDYLGVHADDATSLSCLQERLNQLGENIRIEVI